MNTYLRDEELYFGYHGDDEVGQHIDPQPTPPMDQIQIINKNTHFFSYDENGVEFFTCPYKLLNAEAVRSQDCYVYVGDLDETNYDDDEGDYRETTVIEWLAAQESKKYCSPPCETRQMCGRSWWKSVGYNSPCRCAHTASKKCYDKTEATRRLTPDGCITTSVLHYAKYDYEPDPDHSA